MVPFNLDIQLGDEQIALTVEQLERFADADGFSKYDVSAGERRSVIEVNVAFEPPIITLQDAEAYYEAVHYPEHWAAYDENEIFTPEELEKIAGAIRQHNREAKVVFAQFLLDF